VFLPILPGQPGGHALKLVGKALFAGDLIAPLQRLQHRPHVFLLKLPEVRAAGIFPAARVGHIEHIPQPGLVTAGVDEGDALAAAPDIPAHALVPELIFGAGGGGGALGVDHKLFVEGVLV